MIFEVEVETDRPVFCCANPLCSRPLGGDPVILVTTAHVRRFCSVACIAVGHKLHEAMLLARVEVAS